MAVQQQKLSTASRTRKKCRIGKNKKQYWKHGIDAQAVQEFMAAENYDQQQGGLIRERKDENLFSIDRTGSNDNEKLTRRQKAALKKRIEKLNPIPGALSEISKLKSERTFFKKRRETIKKVSKEKEKVAESVTDIWAVDDNQTKNLSIIKKHFLKATKKLQPLKPKTLEHITTILPAVEVADSGASYNPAVDSYVNYVNEIAKEEIKLQQKKEKLEASLKLPCGESYVTEEERLLEQGAGLFPDDDLSDVNNQNLKIIEEQIISKFVKSQPKTSKAQKRIIRQKKQLLLQKTVKNKRNEEHLVFATKRINKEIGDQLKQREESAILRQKKKLLKQFTKRNRLGGGKFEPYEKDLLLPSELTGSLREIRPQGSILLERLKSLQTRNRLPVPGESAKLKSKRKLRFKFVEKKKHQEVTIGSTVI